MTEYSHWGFCTACDAEGRYQVAPVPPAPASADVVLTGTGDVLVHRALPPATACTVAIVIGRDQGALTRPQIAQMLQTWDLAVDLAKGNTEAVTLLPVSQQWSFSRADYLSLDEWRAAGQRGA